MLRSGFRLRFFGLFLSLAFLWPLPLSYAGGKDSIPDRGTLLASKLLASYTKEQLNANFQRLGLTARNGVKIFSVVYQTQIASDLAQPAQASGLVLIPDSNAESFPWISLQHGTIAGKAEAPSLNPGEGLFEASQGFITTVMDYIGYGSSAELFHPYLISKAYVPAGVDILRATRRLVADEALELGPLFLKGYSEGGYATMALQKALETEYSGEFTVRASAPSAGPYDLEVAANAALSRPISNPVNTTFLVLAYDRWLAPVIDLDSVFELDEASLQKLYSSGLSSEQIYRSLPVETRKLIKGEYLDDFLSATPRIAQARLLRELLIIQSLNRDTWVPKTTTRLYHCAEDEIVGVQATEVTLAHFQNLNPDAPVSSVIVRSPDPSRPYTHGSCPLIFAPVSWFAEILSQP